jgi:ADP-ribosylglycohydrolase
MLGAIVGDIIGSVYEFNPVKTKEFKLFDTKSEFTDDSVMTCAEAIALAIFLARKGADKETIRREIGGRFGYDLSRRLDAIRPTCGFDETCRGTVPEAIISFLEARDFEDAIRNAVSLGGDADTMAAITGSIAEAFWGNVPDALLSRAINLLDERLFGIALTFCRRRRPVEAERLNGLRVAISAAD